ncbi:MAG: signal peptidase II [Candidatus Acidiferrales bacterium]
MALRRVNWIWITLGVFAADRATKYAIETMTPLGYHRTYIPSFFAIVHTSNPGIAFGFFSDSPSRWINLTLSVAALVVCILLTWLLFAGHAGSAPGRTGVALILGGALGNLFDRLIHSGVTDFLYVKIHGYEWPSFNCADSAITIGAILIGIELVFMRKHMAGSEGK